MKVNRTVKENMIKFLIKGLFYNFKNKNIKLNSCFKSI